MSCELTYERRVLVYLFIAISTPRAEGIFTKKIVLISVTLQFMVYDNISMFGKMLKGAATDMRYFARSRFFRNLVHKKNFSLTREVVFMLGYVFCQER